MATKKARSTQTQEDDELVEALTNWARPILPHWDTSMPIQFQQVENDQYVNIPPSKDVRSNSLTTTSSFSNKLGMYNRSNNSSTSTNSSIPSRTSSTNHSNNTSTSYDEDEFADEEGGSEAFGRETASGQREAVIRIFGVNIDGNSICAHIHGFYSYIYVQAWDNMTANDLDTFTNALNTRLITETREKDLQKGVLKTDVLNLASVWGYQNKRTSPFIRITLALPTLIPPAKRFLEQGIMVGTSRRHFLTYESNIPYILRFMIDLKMSGGNWIELPANSYTIRDKRDKQTRSQLEVDIDYTKVISHQPEGEWLKMAPLRVLSFDIECAGRKGFFPQPDKDPVIQIASICSISTNIQKPIHKAVHTLNTCSPIPGVQVIANETEQKLLEGWQRHYHEADPDIVVGYNIINFDFPYLIDRAKHLKVANFSTFGRDLNSITKVRTTVFHSKAIGKQENKELNIEGRIQFDVLVALRRDYKLVSYTLNAVSAHFLKQQKEDVHHSIITDLQNGTDDTRRRLAEYCVKDAILPLRLMHKLLLLINYTEMARVTGVPIMFLLQRGQSIKVISQLLRKTKDKGMIVPALRKQISDEKYEGATVIDPIKGYYDTPIATLDFASLYPSIMMAHNLCYSSLLTAQEAKNLPEDQWEKTPNGDYFVKSSVHKGLLPEILQELLSARSRAKKDMEAATDPFVIAVLNGRQLALKISANSVYGFTGAQVGQLPCLAISSSVTAYGREMIYHTRNTVEKHYTKANGYEHDAQVIYGDTDSVMVKFGTQDLAKSMELGREAAKLVSTEFVNPIRLEFEKVYYPYLLMNKKRYAGLYWTKLEKWDKIDAKGIETVRRDNCLLVRNVITEALDTLLVQRSPQKAVDNVKKHIQQLLLGKVDLSLLVISKTLAKGAGDDDYTNKQVHSELAKRMRKRDPLSAPNVGDRVPYVIITGPKDAKVYEKGEEPIHVLENRLGIDADWYLNHQLKKPLERIFEPILGQAVSRELFSGDHTLHVKHSTNQTGKVFQFAKVSLNCLNPNCRVALKDGQTALCTRCEPNRAEIFIDKNHHVRECEDHFSRLWSQCQRCQGSVNQKVLCESKDCPIFYRRKKAQIDLQDAMKELDRFNE